MTTNPFGDPIDRDFLDYVETHTNFWNRKPQLQLIAHTAEREEISPWGLLLACQIHQLSHISPSVVLVKRSGVTGKELHDGTSLNMFGALTAPTGGGKSATFREAMNLIPPKTTPISDGTGQGLTKTFAETVKVTRDDDNKPIAEPYCITQMFTHSVVLHAPEVNTMNAEFTREGSKTASMLRSLWMGETVGSTTGDISRRITLPANIYRFGGLWGVQPVNATGLLAGADDGTPQRWVWAPAQEFRVGSRTHPPRAVPPNGTAFPQPVFNPGSPNFGSASDALPTVIDKDTVMPKPTWVLRPPKMDADLANIRAEERRVLDRDPYAQFTPEQRDAQKRVTMESHMTLSRIKMAVALGFLWGHTSPTDDDWELSAIQLEVSRRELAGAWMRANEAQVDILIEKGTQRGVEMHAAENERTNREGQDILDLADEVWRILQAGPKTTTALRAGISSAKRKRLAQAMGVLTEQGRCLDNNGMFWAVWRGNVIPADQWDAMG